MPYEVTTLSDRERAAIEAVARVWGVSFEEAADRLQSEALAQRVRKKTGRAPAKVYSLPRK